MVAARELRVVHAGSATGRKARHRPWLGRKQGVVGNAVQAMKLATSEARDELADDLKDQRPTVWEIEVAIPEQKTERG